MALDYELVRVAGAVLICALALTSNVGLGKARSFSVFQFPPL